MIVETVENGQKKWQKLWGVRHVPEKRAAKGIAYAHRLEKKKLISPSEAEARIDSAMEQAMEIQIYGDGETPWENVTAGYYTATISLLGSPRYIGKASTPQAAARMFDSALFHLWGFLLRPRTRFNVLRPEDLPHTPPPLLPQVKKLKEKILLEARREGWDIPLFDFTFLERDNDESRTVKRQEYLDTLRIK